MEAGRLKKDGGAAVGDDLIHLCAVEGDEIAFESFHECSGKEIAASRDGFLCEFQDERAFGGGEIIRIAGVHVNGAAEACGGGSLNGGLERIAGD